MKKWAQEEIVKLKDLYASTTGKELAKIFGCTKASIYAKCNHLGLHKEQPRKRHLTAQEKLWMKLNFPYMANSIIALKLNICIKTLQREARKLGLNKSYEFMQDCRRKGARIINEKRALELKGWYSPNLQKGEPYQFKPGCIPHNKRNETTHS